MFFFFKSSFILSKNFLYRMNESAQGQWSSPLIINLGARWRWLISLTCQPLYPRERATGNHWIGGWVGPITGLDILEKRYTSHPCRVSNSGPSSRQSHPAYCDSQVIFFFWGGGGGTESFNSKPHSNYEYNYLRKVILKTIPYTMILHLNLTGVNNTNCKPYS
jgi:hypothetical protein